LRLPLTPLEAALDTDAATLGEILRAVLALLAPDGDVEVVRLLAPLTRCLVLAPGVHRKAHRADGHAGRRVPELRILGQVADEDDAVDCCHRLLLLERGCGLVVGILAARRSHRYWLTGTPSMATCRHVTHHGVVDLQHPRELVERLG